jgi:hypothetical protein
VPERRACSQDASELRAEGAEEGDGLVISMRDGQDVSDEFRGTTFMWSSVANEVSQGRGCTTATGARSSGSRSTNTTTAS